MILAIKIFIRAIFFPGLYFSSIMAMFYTIFKKTFVGLFLLVFLITQPNIHYKFHDYPYGWMVIDLLFLSLIFGVLFQNQKYHKTGNGKYVILLIIITYISAWIASINFSLPLPISTSSAEFVSWKNFIRALLLYFLINSVIKNDKEKKIIVLLIVVILLLVSVKSFRNFSGGSGFSYDKRYGGPFEKAGLGSNHFGAFIASYGSVVLGLFLVDKNKKRRLIYIPTLLFAMHPLFFTYSRGAYLGAIVSLLFLGVAKEKKIILIIFLFVLSWQFILPESVVERITMTKTEDGEIENSAAGRLELWDFGVTVFYKHPILGSGINGFALSVKNSGFDLVSAGVHLTDPHNYYMKVLCDQGLIGLILLLFIFFRAFLSGWKLFKHGDNDFDRGLGIGFSACVISLFLVNIFGDRFSYIMSGSYFWVFWGIVDKSNLKVLNKT